MNDIVACKWCVCSIFGHWYLLLYVLAFPLNCLQTQFWYSFFSNFFAFCYYFVVFVTFLLTVPWSGCRFSVIILLSFSRKNEFLFCVFFSVARSTLTNKVKFELNEAMEKCLIMKPNSTLSYEKKNKNGLFEFFHTHKSNRSIGAILIITVNDCFPFLLLVFSCLFHTM